MLRYDEQGCYMIEDIPFHKDGIALHMPSVDEAQPLSSDSE